MPIIPDVANLTSLARALNIIPQAILHRQFPLKFYRIEVAADFITDLTDELSVKPHTLLNPIKLLVPN
ncbi:MULTISPECIES: hypothetical protein [unclassified Coleofasciculus]|uniref:hypothetical protein n=1 Tax=unclassified Coleofasciculus TaxID=2692782 RepID=UPI0018809F98|nr:MULTISPECIES: hypothetical protein [unclassified Coleofasciculus]MBE9128766.1 hypothetical protein [Coleofasciculus sp. LEGE 07081]MBE9151223.1 hypothetical protein [Coleofasciculus sp. LEGE 07092]